MYISNYRKKSANNSCNICYYNKSLGEIPPYYEPGTIISDDDRAKLLFTTHAGRYEGDLTFAMMLPKMTKSARN